MSETQEFSDGALVRHATAATGGPLMVVVRTFGDGAVEASWMDGTSVRRERFAPHELKLATVDSPAP